MIDLANLFSPISVGKLLLANRIMMAAVGTNSDETGRCASRQTGSGRPEELSNWPVEEAV